MAYKASDHENYGILLGWKADPAGDKIALLMQSTQKVVENDEDVREYRYFLTKQQAVQLGNFLFTVTGATPPPAPKKSFFARLFGG